MSSRPRGPSLLGRRRECGVLDRLLRSARAGESGVLVLRGESGVGKSALAEYLLERASGCSIGRALGVESEMELAFAGLHQLCAPMLNRMERLPGPQREALGVAFGLIGGDIPNRFLVGLGVLGLLAEVSEERPLVCVVDDAQWLDRASLQCLGFVARRSLAERIALIFVVREPYEERELSGFPELVVGGLSDGDARALLDSVSQGALDERVRDQIVAETRGNPLALLELPRGFTPAELAGGFGLLDVRPLASRIEEGFLRRLQSLPVPTQRLLLTAAVEPVGNVSLLWRAAERLGIGIDAAAPAEAAGLIEFGARVRFRHPLVRSAAHRAASLPDRREAHRALAEVTDPNIDPDRLAWHRAHAAKGPDEAVAGELEQSAGRARSRGGVAAAAAFLDRATLLTPEPARRGVRALAAAQAKFDAADPDAAFELLAIAEACPLDELQRARLDLQRAQIASARWASDAPQLLLGAAKRLERLDIELARDTYLAAFGASVVAGRLGHGRGVWEAAEAARAAPGAPQPSRAVDVLVDALAIRFTESYSLGLVPMRHALDVLSNGGQLSKEDQLSKEPIRWLWLTCPVAPEPLALELWDDERWHEMAAWAVTQARTAGALASLPLVLTYRATVHLHAGEFAAASRLIEEADAISEATGNVPLCFPSLLLAAWRGVEEETLELVAATVQEATSLGAGRALGLAEYATAVQYNGLGRYSDGLVAAQRACDHDDLGFCGWALVELVEAAARSDAHRVASAGALRLEERTQAAGTDWALGIQARTQALLSDGEAAEGLYREAIDRLARTRITVHLARAQLLYGEWLRRENRRSDARVQLRTAHKVFSEIGAQAFAGRAGRELLATGERVRKRTVETRDDLTAQEAQIAQLANDGRTNPQIAARLFLSPRTVEWHLGKVFAKLGINSRRELREALADAGATPTTV